MNLDIFTVYDSAAKAYLPPFFLQNVAMALREFEACANSKEHQFGRHPGYYTLFKLGTFQDDTGEWVIYPEPERVATAHELVQQSPQLELVEKDAS